eukprot:scaffold1077_cov344-Pavlova_lutheri.AAC.4
MFEGVEGGGKWGTIHPFFDRVGRALRLPCVDSFTTDWREHFPITYQSEGETDALEDLFGCLTRSYRAFKEELKDVEDVQRF